MPHRTTGLTEQLAAKQRNHSFELLVANWFMLAGWQVYIPLLDSGHATDLLISDGPKFYRIQIKTIEAQDESHKLPNKWKDKKIDYVVVFAKKSNWGYVCPAFQTNEKRINHEDHKRFTQNRKSFLAAFHTIK